MACQPGPAGAPTQVLVQKALTAPTVWARAWPRGLYWGGPARVGRCDLNGSPGGEGHDPGLPGERGLKSPEDTASLSRPEPSKENLEREEEEMKVNVWKAAMIALILAVVLALLLLEMRASQAQSVSGLPGQSVSVPSLIQVLPR